MGSVPAYASENVPLTGKSIVQQQDDIMKLEPFVKVVNHKYVFDKEGALKAGFSQKLVDGQAQYLLKLNELSDQGVFTINNNLSTTANSQYYATRSSCPGKSTPTQYHWWGYSRYMNNCEAKRAVSDLNTAAAVGTIAAGVAALSQKDK